LPRMNLREKHATNRGFQSCYLPIRQLLSRQVRHRLD
jgi:hypothetical protein